MATLAIPWVDKTIAIVASVPFAISALMANGLAVLSVMILVYALLSLGTSIGFVPAQREIVTRGAYRFVRHPIYTGAFVALLAFVLRAYSLLNLAIGVSLVVLLGIRGVVEEHFLSILRSGQGGPFRRFWRLRLPKTRLALDLRSG